MIRRIPAPHRALTALSALAALLLAGHAAAGDLPATPPPDPWIGSYFYQVALDQRCPVADEARAEALARFKHHFLVNSRIILGGLPPDQAAPALRKLDAIERDGPPADELTRFDDFFARRTSDEISVLCANAPKAIEEQMKSEGQLLHRN